MAALLWTLSDGMNAWPLGRVVDDCVRRHLVARPTLRTVYGWLAVRDVLGALRAVGASDLHVRDKPA